MVSYINITRLIPGIEVLEESLSWCFYFSWKCTHWAHFSAKIETPVQQFFNPGSKTYDKFHEKVHLFLFYYHSEEVWTDGWICHNIRELWYMNFLYKLTSPVIIPGDYKKDLTLIKNQQIALFYIFNEGFVICFA